MSRWGSTKKEATERLKDALDEALRVGGVGDVRSSDTVSSVAKLWLANLETQDLADSTLRNYRSLTNAHVLSGESEFPDLDLRSVTPAKVSAELQRVEASSGPGASKSLRSIYRGIFELALENEAIESNPARNFRVKRLRQEEPDDPEKGRAFTRGERDHILALVAKDKKAARYQDTILIQMLAGTGERIGEAIAETWGDVFWDLKRLHVPGTKSESADRIIAIPDWLLEILRARHKALSPADSDLICPTVLGKRRDVSNSIRSVSRWLDKNGFPWATSHTFRRTVATLLDDEGFTPRQIAVHLGHSQPSMTMNTYMDRAVVVDRIGGSL